MTNQDHNEVRPEATYASSTNQNDLFLDPGQEENHQLVSHLETFKKKFADLALIHKEQTRQRATEWSPERRRKALAKFRLFSSLLQGAKSKDDLIANLNRETERLQKIQKKNREEVNGKIKEFERVVRALDLLHQNRGGAGRVQLMLVPEREFANPASSAERNSAIQHLITEYGKFEMTDSPLYLTYLGELNDSSVILALAEACRQTQALALVDLPPEKDVEEVKATASHLGLLGVDEKHAHLVTTASQVHVPMVTRDGSVNGDGMLPIPVGPAIVGRLMSRQPGQDIAGIQHPMVGISTVETIYNVERQDAEELANLGLVMIGKGGKILGSRTGNRSDNPDLAQYLKVDTKNVISKALVQFANNAAYTSISPSELKKFEDAIKGYLNDKVRVGEIVTFQVEVIPVGNEIDVKLSIKFKDVNEKVTYYFEGPPGALQSTKKPS